MDFLQACVRQDQLIVGATSRLLVRHAIEANLRMLKKYRRSPYTRRKTSIDAVSNTSGGLRVSADASLLPSMEMETESDLVTTRRDPLFDDTFGQTIYVQKGEVEQSSYAETPPPRHAEIVPDSPSLSLVRQKPPINKSRQRRRIITEVLTITLPAMAALMADPLMSLVDTGCVGQISAVDLAALGPNTSIFNMIGGVFSVMAASTASRMASNSMKSPGLSAEEKTRRREENERVLSHSLVLSASVGVFVMGCLFAFGPALLRAMGATPAVMKPALHYLYIRAIALPACLFMSTSQGACLGQQDMWTPMKVMLIAGLINLMGDISLIMFAGLGTAGAAAATTASQIAGAAFFFSYLRRGGERGGAVKLKWRGLPNGSTLKPILKMARVLVPRCFVLMATYTGMTAVATAAGTVTLAAHQVTLQVFWLLATMTDAGSLTAQSLIARDRNDKRKIREVSWTLVRLATYAGMLVGAILGCALKFFPQCFASDHAVIAAFQAVIPQAMLGLLVYPVCVSMEGISIGMNQMEHLPNVIITSTGMTMFALWVTQRLQLGLNGIWSSAIVFFALRTFLQIAHLARNWAQTAFGAWEASRTLQPQFATN